MKVRVLGSAAGGGFPQWNCNCRNCAGVRDGSVQAKARTQSSIAVSGDGVSWVLINTSPDLLAQLRSFPALQPGRSLRDTAISDVMLVDAQLDHTLGLLMLREGKPLRVWCSERVHAELTRSHPIFPLLQHYCGVEWQRLPLEPGTSFVIPSMPSVRCRALAVPGNAPPFSPARDAPEPGDNIALSLTESRTEQTLFYAPGLGAIEPTVAAELQQAHTLLVDGTFWSEEELPRLGVSARRARQMGHLPQSGEGGMLSVLRPLRATRKILIHINNTNPILDERSPERASLTSAGVEVAYDGLELEL
ncbi:MAG: Coenzyme biosynthesis protein [Pseudomonadota bacterium]|jgi:pyrroloquinoline quinone biosynthesis protein B